MSRDHNQDQAKPETNPFSSRPAKRGGKHPDDLLSDHKNTAPRYVGEQQGQSGAQPQMQGEQFDGSPQQGQTYGSGRLASRGTADLGPDPSVRLRRPPEPVDL